MCIALKYGIWNIQAPEPGAVNALVGGGYAVRAGEDIYVRGPGYLGSGEVYTVERGA